MTLTGSQKNRFSSAWHNLDTLALTGLRNELDQNLIDDTRAIEGFVQHQLGNLAASAQIYETIQTENISDPLLRELLNIERPYVAMKLKRSSEQKTIFQMVRGFLRLFRFRRESLATDLKYYYLNTWFIRAFWYNQYSSLVATILLFVYGFVTGNREAKTHGRFVMGHVLNVMGYPKLGVPLVVNTLPFENLIQPWQRASIFCFLAYGLFMVGREEHRTPEIFEIANEELTVRPDPFYRILYWVTALRASSQAGDVVKSETVAPILIEISERTGSKRFLYSSMADLALCYGIRGMLWKCDELLRELIKFDSDGIDPVEVGSFLRLRGWAYFFVGRYRDALLDAEGSVESFGKSKSFYMAVEMAKVLKIVSSFRIQMERLTEIDLILKAAEKHKKDLFRLKRRYKRNSILLQMIREEEDAFTNSFQRFSQPGYSRASCVVSCQQELHAQIHEVIHAADDSFAWKLIGRTIDKSLGVEMTMVTQTSEAPGFRARRSQAFDSVVEVAVRRDSHFDIIHFRCRDKYQVPVTLDALFTLQPTLVSHWKTRDLQNQIIDSTKVVATAELAKQVAHDIRSPLSALNMVIATFETNDDGKRSLIRNAVIRINDIANSLLSKGRFQGTSNLRHDNIVPHQIGYLLDSIISEKRLQYSEMKELSIELDIPAIGSVAFVELDQSVFKRVISNLINNAVEAMNKNSGLVYVSVEAKNDRAIVSISDNGRGIPSRILPLLTTKGFTYEKSSGSGLGLSYAKSCVVGWRGQLEIKSEEGGGTTVVINLPQSNRPSWFAPTIDLQEGSDVIALDDDQSVLQIWSQRLNKLERGIFTGNYRAFSSVNDFIEHVTGLSSAKLSNTRFLVDYELSGYTKSGLEIVSQLGLSQQAFLVTSRCEDLEVQEQCSRLGIQMIPKSFVPFVSIEVHRNSSKNVSGLFESCESGV